MLYNTKIIESFHSHLRKDGTKISGKKELN